MTTVGTRNLTLADIAARKDPDGKIAKIVEILSEDHEILDDAVFTEANDGTNHKTTVRTGIPTPTWRKLYGGVLPTKGTTKQVVDSCGMLEALPEVDCDVIDKSGDPAAAMMTEVTPHIEGIKQTLESTLFYGDTALYPERFMGLAPRYDAYCRATPDKDYSDYNVLTGGGSASDNTSIWLINWGDAYCSMLYPKGSSAGLSQDNLGKTLVDAADSSGKYQAYVTKFKWDVGLTVRDWRSVGRICNIDVSNLEASSSAADLITLMIKLSERVKGTGRRAWYMHPRVRTMLRIQMLSDTNVNLTFDDVAGRKVMMFDGIPVRTSEQILLTESALSQAS